MSAAPAILGIDELRNAVAALNNVNETFLNGGPKPFTPEQLLTIYRAWKACEWDIWPDQWEERQYMRALRGIVPTFKPGKGGIEATYPKDAPRVKVSR